MEITADDKRMAAEFVYRSSRLVRWFCPRTEENDERIGRMADAVWSTCKRMNAKENDEPTQYQGKSAIQSRNDYQDTVSFIPVWLLGIIIQIIVRVLIDYFLVKRGSPSK
jgi:hypothetical protein